MTNNNTLEPIYTLQQLSICISVPKEIISQISAESHKLYQPFKQLKGDGKFRTIDNPQKKLKAIQKKIKQNILDKYDFPDQIMGGRKGYGIKDYLEVHINQKEVVSLDIKSCFPSVSHRQIFKIFRENYAFSKEIASILTKLTTYRGHLPQGAPSSNSLLNILLAPAAIKIAELSKKNNCNISFWVDDITLSGENPSKLIQDVVLIIHEYGFAIKSSKTKIMRSSHRQEVLNHVVNRKASILKSKQNEYLRNYFGNQSPTQIMGILAHLDYINPKQAERFRKIIKFDQEYL